MRRNTLTAILLVWALSLWGFNLYADEVLGKKPGYLVFARSRVPNQEAIGIYLAGIP